MGASKSVLVVDDDGEWVEAISDFLEEEGYTIETAKNGLEALERLASDAPVMVVMTDVQMPIMDGCQLLAKVRARYPELPVVLVTSERCEADEPRFSGAIRIIHKPMPVSELLSALTEAERLTSAAAPPKVSTATQPKARPAWSVLRGSCASFAHAAPTVMLALVVVSSVVLAGHWLVRTK